MTVYKLAIIIGAPRSGTNMMRDVLTSLSGVATWPCDEINYIWRHGNVRHPSDEFKSDMARPQVCSYIRRQFDWVAKKYQVHTVVEKTCANSLRVGFVDRVVPEAKYIFIRRDGLDVVSSAIKRWKAGLDIRYLTRKARFVPAFDLPYYASSFLWNRIYRLLSREERLAFWGPKLDGMEELLVRYSLEEVCAIQWKRCVDKAEEVLAEIPAERWTEVSYESFVKKPEEEFKRIAEFLGMRALSDSIARAVKGASPRSIGKGRRDLGAEAIDRLMPFIQQTMLRYGYA
ncbi:MAG: sulfotransferase [Desulfobacterales bacterium]